MFESDDFDQVLSQFDFPEEVTTHLRDKSNQLLSPEIKSIQVTKNESITKNILTIPEYKEEKSKDARSDQIKAVLKSKDEIVAIPEQTEEKSNNARNSHNSNKTEEFVSPKQAKRKMINCYFDHRGKRKFPGPAGLLTSGLGENKDETICQIELLSQDVDFSQNSLRGDLFDSPLWSRLLDDLKSWNLNNVDSIKSIKQQAISGPLRRRKAHVVTAFVETVDRSTKDPLIMIRDLTGSIKGTLHRDAWTAFSQYIASNYCALVLWKPTILTTGGAYKKHYLIITLSNIHTIYSSTVLNDDANNVALPEGYVVVYNDEFTVIKSENYSNSIGNSFTFSTEPDGANDLLDGLDNIFSDEIF